MSLNSVASTRPTPTSTKSSPMFHTPTESRVTVPGIGVASQLPEGVVEVMYPDGSRLTVTQPEQGGGVTYTQINGNQCHYTAKDELPEIVRIRLTQIPIVIKHLMVKNSNEMIANGFGTPVNLKCIQSTQQMRYFR